MSEPTKSWFSDLPAPKALVAALSVEELKSLMSDSKLRAGVDFVVVDVRRADMDVSDTIFFAPCMDHSQTIADLDLVILRC
jgi:hypothetical protein